MQEEGNATTLTLVRMLAGEKVWGVWNEGVAVGEVVWWWGAVLTEPRLGQHDDGWVVQLLQQRGCLGKVVWLGESPNVPEGNAQAWLVLGRWALVVGWM